MNKNSRNTDTNIHIVGHCADSNCTNTSMVCVAIQESRHKSRPLNERNSQKNEQSIHTIFIIKIGITLLIAIEGLGHLPSLCTLTYTLILYVFPFQQKEKLYTSYQST